MRSNALKKQELFEKSRGMPVKLAVSQSWESWRLSIALQAEAACHLPGNTSCPDFEEFLSSDFA